MNNMISGSKMINCMHCKEKKLTNKVNISVSITKPRPMGYAEAEVDLCFDCILKLHPVFYRLIRVGDQT